MASVNDNIGNYRLVKELASGAFGRVYQGEHIILTNRIVAIKLLHGVHLNSQKERPVSAKLTKRYDVPDN